MKVLLPISYLGPVSYYIIILKSENIFFETNEFFVKQSLRNRCSILSANGKQVLSIPKERKSADKTRISEIKISNSHKWQKIHWQALLSSYNSSPFFEHYKDNFFDFYHTPQSNLFDLNFKLTQTILSILQIEKKINFTSHFEKKFDGIDYRNHKFRSINIEKYEQVYFHKFEFYNDLSIIDLIFNLGPETTSYLERQSI